MKVIIGKSDITVKIEKGILVFDKNCNTAQTWVGWFSRSKRKMINVNGKDLFSYSCSESGTSIATHNNSTLFFECNKKKKGVRK